MTRLRIIFGVVALFALVCVPMARAQTPPDLLFECEHTVSGGDNLTRGFYIPSFPGSRLDAVDVWMESSQYDTWTVALTARAGTYDGTILGIATSTFSLDDEQDLVTFDFGGIAIEPGSAVAFTFEIQDGTEPVYFNVGTCNIGDTGCTACDGGVVETEGTDPPLSSFRRNSVGIRVYGSAQVANPIPALGRYGLLLFVLLILGAGVLVLKGGFTSLG